MSKPDYIKNRYGDRISPGQQWYFERASDPTSNPVTVQRCLNDMVVVRDAFGEMRYIEPDRFGGLYARLVDSQPVTLASVS